MKVDKNIYTGDANWKFDKDVPLHFDKHIMKSVPFYNEGHALVAKISDFFLQDNSLCYDLGCSTGKLLTILAERHKNKKIKFIGIDSVKEMTVQSTQKCAPYKNIKILNKDITEYNFEKADFIISYYTMQFIRPKHRQNVFNEIYSALNWGGGFLLFEKVRAPDARFQDMMSQIYADYKLDIGYSPEEIIGKSRSLKGILEPFSTQGNIDLLKRAGFIDIMTVMKYVCFEGFLAIK